MTWPAPSGRFHDFPPMNPLDPLLSSYDEPHNIRTQHPQETLNLIHIVPHANLSTFERYYPNYAADPTHFLSLEGQYISRHEGRTDPDDLTTHQVFPLASRQRRRISRCLSLHRCCSIASCIGYFELFCALLYAYCTMPVLPMLLCVSLDCSVDGVSPLSGAIRN